MRRQVLDTVAGEITLRSKKELIERFINEALPEIEDSEAIPEAFEQFVETEKGKAFVAFCADENIDPDKLQKMLSDYLFTQLDPQPDDIINALNSKPKVLQRQSILERILRKIKDFIETYVNGVGA